MTDMGSAPAYTRRFWAKSDRREPGRIHLLEHHLADVGACFEALLAQPTIRQRLARSGALDSLDHVTAARLALFAAFHDIGKVNVGFQTRIWKDTDLPAGRRRPGRAGHALDVTPVLTNEDAETANWFFDSLDWWWGAAESWDDCGGETVCALFTATLSHHGLPVQLEGARPRNPAIWRDYGGLKPREYVRRIGELARRWFPAAWEPVAPSLPSAPAFQHMFLGLCTLADWLGSNETWFPYRDEPDGDYMVEARRQARKAIDSVGLDLSQQRAATAGGLPDFAQLFDFGANPIQRAAVQDVPLDERLVVIESETGSGKTEAALWRFARMYEQGLVDGLYFALPTRAAATQLHGRVERFVEQLFPGDHRPETVLAVPGYLKTGDATGQHLQDYEVWWDDHPDDATRGRRWAAEGAKRYLAAQIAVGTVDQSMMAALKVKHAHMRAACLARNLLVVDEVHASETYMRGILKALLDAHLAAGGYASRCLVRSDGPLHVLTDEGLTYLARRDRAAVGLTLDRWSAEAVSSDSEAYAGTALRAIASQLRHQAGITDFAAALTAETARSPDYELFDLLPTSRSFAGYSHFGTSYVVHPDASFLLEWRGRSRPYFLEFERRATTPRRVPARLESYRRYFLSGWADRDHDGRLPLVLFLFESPAAEDAFLRAAAGVEGTPFFSSNVEVLADRGILGDSWRLPPPHPPERAPLRSLTIIRA